MTCLAIHVWPSLVFDLYICMVHSLKNQRKPNNLRLESPFYNIKVPKFLRYHCVMFLSRVMNYYMAAKLQVIGGLDRCLLVVGFALIIRSENMCVISEILNLGMCFSDQISSFYLFFSWAFARIFSDQLFDLIEFILVSLTI